MADLLELCRYVARESGTLAGGATLTTVSAATGRTAKVVGWVVQAWLDIQNERNDWLWMKREFTSALVINQTRYTASDFDIARLSAWAIDRPAYCPFTLYDTTIGAADETLIGQVPYDTWRGRYDRGSHDANRPTIYAISPALEFCVGAKPDKAYAFRGEYRLAPQILAADADIPELPSQHHYLIGDEALRMMGESDEAPLLIQTASARARIKRRALGREQLPGIYFAAEALA